MSEVQQPKRYSFPSAPVERNHPLIQLAAQYVGGDTEHWGVQEWELASRYLARALETATIISLQLAESFDFIRKKPRGRPRKGKRLCDLLGLGDPKTKPRRGRPLKWTDEDWLNLNEVVNSCRQALTRKNRGKRVTDKMAVTFAVALVATEEGRSQSWIRRAVPEFQKLYSESKRRVRKIRENP